MKPEPLVEYESGVLAVADNFLAVVWACLPGERRVVFSSYPHKHGWEARAIANKWLQEREERRKKDLATGRKWFFGIELADRAAWWDLYCSRECVSQAHPGALAVTVNSLAEQHDVESFLEKTGVDLRHPSYQPKRCFHCEDRLLVIPNEGAEAQPPSVNELRFRCELRALLAVWRSKGTTPVEIQNVLTEFQAEGAKGV